jgi:hypothetical protein
MPKHWTQRREAAKESNMAFAERRAISCPECAIRAKEAKAGECRRFRLLFSLRLCGFASKVRVT